ncbi:hypothetical protein [Dyella acidiphila]|uniref:Uncharacterized protein n=1 Tax=Dyella acidiphila TaxID=2775866 RepID=A0ABR9GFK8_9GAMM|nr:hypothetical protein [Dyella acidiphila]MBE1162800.1 hypothetical protein [Dyella acidiphila]
MNSTKLEYYNDAHFYDHDYGEINRYKNFIQVNPNIIKVQEKLARIKPVPYSYFGTLSFQYDLRPDEATKVASTHWRKVQKHSLGRNWIKKGMEPLTGLIVMERHPIYNKKTTQIFSTCHFHHLIYDHPALGKNKLAAAYELDSAFAEAACGLTHKNKRWQLVSRYGTRVLPVYDTMQICGYVAKEAWHYTWEWSDRIGYLCKDGVV